MPDASFHNLNQDFYTELRRDLHFVDRNPSVEA